MLKKFIVKMVSLMFSSGAIKKNRNTLGLKHIKLNDIKGCVDAKNCK